MIPDVNCNKILSASISHLDEADVNESMLAKNLPLLTFFAQEIIENGILDKECDTWLNDLTFGFCLKYLESSYFGKFKLLDNDCYKLLMISCKRKSISVELLKYCIALIDFHKNNNNKFSDSGCDDISSQLSLEFAIRLVQDVFQSHSDFGREHDSVKQGIITSVNHLLKCDDITDSCFILICGLLKDLINPSVEKETTLIWASIGYIYDQKKYDRLMLIISVVLHVISNSFIIKKTLFWTMVQQGIIFADPLARKRALFIIKWLLDHVSKEDHFSTDLSDDGSGVIFSWEKDTGEEAWSIWKTIILLLETLDEKQMHVISPVLPLINDVYSASIISDNGHLMLHSSWMLVIIQRSLNHESKLLNKWALQYCLTTNLEKYFVASKESLQFIFVDLTKSLQTIYFYNRDEDDPLGSPPQILDLMIRFICNCLEYLGDRSLEFINMVLDAIHISSFNDISLVYFTEALSHQTLSSSLSSAEVSKFKQFCFSKIRIHRIEYQKVIFQNLSLFFVNNLLPEKTVSSEIIQLMAYAVDYGFLLFNGNCWNMWFVWFNKICDEHKEEIFTIRIQEFLLASVTCMKSNTSISSTEFSILVLFHCTILPQINVKLLLRSLSDVVDKLHSNPYLDMKKISKVFELTMSLFKGTSNFSYSIVSHLYAFLASSLPNILQHTIYTYQQFSENNENYEIFERCLCLLEYFITVSQCNEFGKMISVELRKFFEKIYSTLLTNLKSISCIFGDKNTQTNYHVMCSRLFSIKLLRYYLGWIDAKVEDSHILNSLLVNVIINCDRKVLNTMCKKIQVSKVLNCDSILSDIWCCLKSLHENHLNYGDSMENRLMLLETFFSDITIVSHEHILDVTQFSSSFISMFIDDKNQLICIIDYMWKIVKEQSQTDHSFWNIYMCCIKCIFHEQLLLSADKDIIEKLKEMWGYILTEGEKKINVINIFITHCVEIWTKHDNLGTILVNYIDQFISTAISGPLLNKCSKPMDDLIYYLQKSERYDKIGELKSAHYSNLEVRVIIINFLINLKEDNDISRFFNQLKSCILETALKLAKSRKCYYPNTLIHRKILRSWQLFLILLGKHSSSFNYDLVLPQLYLSIKTAHQTSIRYLIEWCILLIFQQNNKLVETLLDEMDKGSEKQIISVTSMMSLCIHLAALLKGSHFEMFVRKTVPKVLPWSHAQHMTSRIYAQVVLENIWENIMNNNNQLLQDEFCFLSYCFSLKVDNTAAVKNRTDLKEQFFYSDFCPLDHYSLETIYHTFPAHSGILNDEWITEDKFFLCEESVDPTLKLRVNNQMDLCMPIKMDEKEIVDIPNHIDEKLVDIQKKIMPWRVLPPTEDVALQSELQKKKESKSSQLILCAVLVDKIPNLGGLCRTAEIFGVSSLIIGSHRYVEDRGFKSLSVSAERWLNIEQVLPIKLSAYLKEMKANGYHIIGVEQTANSKMIGQYSFPELSVLVLGNEKTGIPVDLIQILDECVEIPQVGIIRSLNVHISGAIMIWEYCKQHVLNIAKY